MENRSEKKRKLVQNAWLLNNRRLRKKGQKKQMGRNHQYKISRKFLGIHGHVLLDGKSLPNTQHKGCTIAPRPSIVQFENPNVKPWLVLQASGETETKGETDRDLIRGARITRAQDESCAVHRLGQSSLGVILMPVLTKILTAFVLFFFN